MTPPKLTKKSLVQLRQSLLGLNLVGLVLRGASMLSKLALVMLMTEHDSLEMLGVYGLFVSSIALLNYLQGLEFNRFTTREILDQEPYQSTLMVGNQLVVHFLTYIVVLPLSLVVFTGGFLSWEFLFSFIWIAIFSHLGQEANRLLIVFAKANEAYIVSFVIHGLWACIAVAIYLTAPELITLSRIFLLWCGSSALGLVFGVIYLIKTRRLGSVKLKIDKEWISLGLKISVKFFIGVIAFKVIELSDRYFIQYFHGDAWVGAYTFYGSVANIVMEFVYTGTVVMLLPELLTTYKKNQFQRYNENMIKFRDNIWLFSTLATALVIILTYFLVDYIDRDLLNQNFDTFLLLVATAFVLNISLIPNYKLYLAGEDSALMWSALSGVVLNVMLNFMLIPRYGVFGAAVATIISFSLVYALKLWFVRRLVRVEQV